MKRTLFALAAVLLAASPALAQNPCTAPNTHAILTAGGVNHAYAELPEQTAVLPDGTPIVVDYQYAVWTEGADPNVAAPAQGPTTIPKAAWVPVAGAAGCYELTGGLPGLIPTTARLAASLRARAQAGAPAAFSAWAALSNSFSLASPRPTPAAVGRTRIQP